MRGRWTIQVRPHDKVKAEDNQKSNTDGAGVGGVVKKNVDKDIAIWPSFKKGIAISKMVHKEAGGLIFWLPLNE